MSCLSVIVKEASNTNGRLKVTTSIVCSVAQNTTLTGLLDKLGRILFDSKERKLVTRK